MDLGQDAVRAEDQDQEQQQVGHDLRVAGRDVARGERLDQADDQPAEQRARQRAEAADHRRGEGLDAEQADRRVDGALGGEQDARHRRHHAGQRPDQRLHPLDRDAHVVGGELVLRRGLHRHAELGAVEVEVEHQRQQHRDHDHRDLVEAEHEAAEADVAAGDRRLQRDRLVPPHQAREEAQHEAERDRQDDDGDLRLARHAPEHHEVERVAEGPHDEDGDGHGDPEGQPHEFRIGQPEADERAQHHEVALGEINRLGRLVDQDEAHRDQAVDAAVCKAAHDQLQDIQTCYSSLRATSLARRRRPVRSPLPAPSEPGDRMPCLSAPGTGVPQGLSTIFPVAPLSSTRPSTLPASVRGYTPSITGLTLPASRQPINSFMFSA